MRKQYYFRPSERGLLAWDVGRLIERSSQLPRKRIPLHTISELTRCGSGTTRGQPGEPCSSMYG